MKATGVVRRIDELGRVVIPKEIRKNLRIREGENMEIYVDANENIVLKKFSLMKKLGDFAQNFTDSIYSFLKHNILITDTDHILAASGPLKKELLGKPLSEQLLSSIMRRDHVLEKHEKDLSLTPEITITGTYIIYSILCNGDVAGLVLLFSETEGLTEIEEKVTQIAAQFLTKYLEE